MPSIWSCFDHSRLYYITFYLMTMFMTNINSKTSTHWFLNEIKEQVVPGLNHQNNEQSEYCQHSDNKRGSKYCCNSSLDAWDSSADSFGYIIMHILTDKSRIFYENDTWELQFSPDSLFPTKSVYHAVSEVSIPEQPPHEPKIVKLDSNISKTQMITSYPSTPKNTYPTNEHSKPVVKEIVKVQKKQNQNLVITCSPYANQTQYDHLNGIHSREAFKFFPEPEVALMFGKRSEDNSKIEINLNGVIAQLLEAKIKKPKSSNVFNNIGNLLRIHGESREAVECFRYALRLSPHHPDVLLNLARVLYNQNFLEDAIYLTRHSLEIQPRNRNPWLQHFTLGEFLRSSGHKQEAQYHFIQSLEFNPGFAPAKDYLKEFSVKSNAINIVYSFCISVFLLSLVLYIAFLNLEFYNVDNENQKSHRHFNRGMAMKALKTINAKARTRR